LSFPYKHILVIGATSGIGKGLSERFVKAGIKVTAVGSPRRRDRLDEFLSIDGTSKAGGVAFDYMGDHERIIGMPLDEISEKAYELVLTGKGKIIIGTVGPAGAGGTAEMLFEVVGKRRIVSSGFLSSCYEGLEAVKDGEAELKVRGC
jgi:NAD(P)-dependent dehydrogenase (short-subunit alcohol dehydrogenase family)